MKVASKLPGDDTRLLQGNLQQVPFAQLLVELWSRRSTGTLHVHGAHDATRARVRFSHGLPVAAAVGSSGETLAQCLIPLCACADAEYRFAIECDDVGVGAGVVSGSVDPLALINAAMRGPLREDAVAQTIDALAEQPLRLHPRIDLGRYAFTPQEREVASAFSCGPTTVAELLLAPGANARLVRRVVYVLVLTRGAAPLPGARATSGTIDRVAPPSAAGEVACEQRSSAPPAASGRYHVRFEGEDGPTDRVPSPRSASMAAPASGALAQSVARSADARHARTVEAEAQRREAERLLRRSDYPGALHCAHRALRAEGSAVNEALYGWLLYLNGGDPSRVPPRAFRHLERALQREPDCVDARYYLGVLHRRMGRDDEANAHFKRVLRQRPDHEGAARELRLWQMRSRSQSSSGLLKKLFGGGER